MEKDPSMFKKLQRLCQLVHKALSMLALFTLQGDPDSPVKHLYLRNPPNCPDHELNLLSKIVDFCIEHGIAVVTAAYLQMEKFTPKNSIRVTVNTMLTEDEIKNVAVVLDNASSEVL
jgi:7-keto-8-aminopelargonate synthetase-like enzyme